MLQASGFLLFNRVPRALARTPRLRLCSPSARHAFPASCVPNKVGGRLDLGRASQTRPPPGAASRKEVYAMNQHHTERERRFLDLAGSLGDEFAPRSAKYDIEEAFPF